VNDQLSLRRLVWVLRNDVMRSYRSWLVISGTTALIALLVSVLAAYDGVVGNWFYPTLFLAMLFSWGTIGTSLAFADLHDRTTNAAFLLLPASALEKTVSRLLLTTVGLFVYLLLLTTVLSGLLEGINMVAFGVRRELFVPFDRVAWMMLPHYLVAQSLFFLGAAWFRKVHFVKTVGSALLIVFALAAAASTIAWIAGSPILGGDIRIDNFDAPLEWLVNIATLVYYVALPVFCWFVAWLRVTEAQVSHGI
jgi:hypothetical protein